MGCSPSQPRNAEKLPTLQTRAVEIRVDENDDEPKAEVFNEKIVTEDTNIEPVPSIVPVNDNTSEAFSLLLCGAGESGKTTFTRQMQLKFFGEVPPKERKQYISTIRGNLVETIQQLLVYLERVGISLDEDLIEQAENLGDLDAFECEFTPELAEDLKAFWSDSKIQNAFTHRDELGIADHIDYFFQKIDDLVPEDYSPTNEDILKARVRTIGYTAVTFDIDGALVRIFDVGGQKTERKVWGDVLKQVESCIFCVSFADFDKPMFEDQSILRIEDSLNLFEDIANKKIFSEGPIFLLCNKIDSFEKKVRETDRFLHVFPEYSGNPHDPVACADFLIEKFKDKGNNTEIRPIIPYKIVALNPDDVSSATSQICSYINKTQFEDGQ